MSSQGPDISDFNSTMDRIKAENERYDNSTPEYKILHGVINNISNAFYAIKYKQPSAKETALLELAEAKGKVTALALSELNKTERTTNG